MNPATASASVHLAEVGTTLVAGTSHWRFGNVDWKLVLRLGVPGAVGAFLGATVLSALSTEDAAPYMAGVLLALGVNILAKFSLRPPKVAVARTSPHGSKFLSPLGLVAGFVDASGRCPMALEALVSQVIDFQTVSTAGLQSSPVAEALAGLRANEARYFKNKYNHVFTVDPAGDTTETIDWVNRVLKNERDIAIGARPLEATSFVTGGIRFAYVFYESSLSINVMYGLESGAKRAVGFKLSEGMPIPDELAPQFTFARQKSKLAGTIRGSYFVIKGEY